jgi:hypothetical protein
VAQRSIAVLDVVLVSPRGAVVLQLDAQGPLIGLKTGASVTLVFKDGEREQVEYRGLGFASATPETAHIIVSSPKRVIEGNLASVEIDVA